MGFMFLLLHSFDWEKKERRRGGEAERKVSRSINQRLRVKRDKRETSEEQGTNVLTAERHKVYSPHFLLFEHL